MNVVQVTVVVVATTSKEGSDRPTLSLGSAQDTLITSLAAVNTSLIVSVIAPGPVLMPWEDDVSTILYHGLPGQESGNALADVLFGHVNPSARYRTSAVLLEGCTIAVSVNYCNVLVYDL